MTSYSAVDQHETKCTFRILELDFAKNMHYCA